jgi:hypothetical protein
MKLGADQGMMLRVWEMMVFSALEYGSAAYGLWVDHNAKLKRLEPVHNKGLRNWRFLRVQNRKHYV